MQIPGEDHISLQPQLLQSDYIYLHMVQAALGKPAGWANTPDPDVQVASSLFFLDPPANTHAELAVQVIVDNPAKTQALATLITQAQKCANVDVDVYVKDLQGKRITPEPLPTTSVQMQLLFEAALKGNWYFLRIQSGNPYTVPFFVELRNTVVQFYNDSLLSKIACGSRTAEDVFRQLFQVEKIGAAGVHMSMTTALVVIPSPPPPSIKRKTVRERVKRMLQACNPFSCCYGRVENSI